MAGLPAEGPRIRERKSVLAEREGLGDASLTIIDNHIAGSPMDDTIKWTSLFRPSIAE